MTPPITDQVGSTAPVAATAEAERVAVATPADRLIAELVQKHLTTPPPSRPAADLDFIQQTFSRDQLLVRAMEPIGEIFAEESGIEFDFSSWRQEYGRIQNSTLRASSTLLIPGQSIPTYKPYGFIFDAATATVHGAYEADCGSCTREDGTLNIPEEGRLTVKELAGKIRTTRVQTHAMNEVLATYSTPIGLFVRNGDKKQLIEILLIQKRLQQKHHLSLPLYLYEQGQGTLIYSQIDADQIRMATEAFPLAVRREIQEYLRP